MKNKKQKIEIHTIPNERARYAAKSMTKLQEELKQFEKSLERLENSPPDDLLGGTNFKPFLTKHIAFLKMTIVERIGKK